MPLVNEPALAFDCGCLTIIRLTGRTRARASMCCFVVGEDAARMALAGDLVDPAYLVEGVVEPVVAVDGEERGQLLTRKAVLTSDLRLLSDHKRTVVGYRDSGGSGSGLTAGWATVARIRAPSLSHIARSSSTFSSADARYPPSARS